MSSVKLTFFSGERPRISDRLLPIENAKEARNVRLTNGALVPLRAPKEQTGITSFPSGTLKTVYRLYDDTTDYWMGWTEDVDIARAPLEGDTSFRFAYTSDSFEPRVSDLSMATGSTPYPDDWFVLGVTPPETAPTVTPSGGSGTNEDRVYVYTFVTDWGEESAPSPASTITTGKDDDTWAISAMDTAPPNSFTISAGSWSSNVATVTLNDTFGLRVGEYVTITGVTPSGYNAANVQVLSISTNDITYALASDPGTYTSGGTATRDAAHNTTDMVKRIYRSVTTATDTNYYYVGEVPVATTSFNDTASIVIGEELPTDNWNMPPVDMQGISTLASGSMVGFSKNTVYVSEPLAIYAYPPAYEFVTNYNIIGIGTIGTAVVVVTDGYPFVINGVSPESMTMERIDQFWAGTSKNSIVESEYGVMWATNEGIVRYGVDGAALITSEHYTQFEWGDINSDQFMAAYHDNRYYAAYTDDNGIGQILIFDTENGGILHFADSSADSLYSDVVTNELYTTEGNVLYKWDSDDTRYLPQTWWSKAFALHRPESLAIAKVEGEYTQTAEELAALQALVDAQETTNEGYMSDLKTLDGSLNTHTVNSQSLNGSNIVPLSLIGDSNTGRVTFNLYINEDELYYSTQATSNEPFRLPSGQLYEKFSVQVQGAMRVDEIHVATSLTEMRDPNG